MAGGDVVRIDGAGVVEELAELEPIVAANAGIGRAAGVVLSGEVILDAAKILAEIHHIKRHIQKRRDHAGIGSIVD